MTRMLWPRWASPTRGGCHSGCGSLLHMRRGKLSVGCVSMVMLLLLFSCMVVLDIIRLRSGRLDLLVYGEDDERFAIFKEDAYVDDETFCEYRQRVSHQGHTFTDQTGSDAANGSDVTASQAKVKGRCMLPKLDPCDPQIIQFDTVLPRLQCSKEENWVYVKNGTFRISASAIQRHGKIMCEYAPIVRGIDGFSIAHGPHIKPMPDGAPLPSDFFKAACITNEGTRYFNIHMGVAYKQDLHTRGEETPLPATALGGYDVFFFGFDSTSRMAWMRNLPQTRDYFINKLGGIELEGLNVVGDGTVKALLPLMTGQTEDDLPCAKKDVKGSVFVDDFPWIWKDFKKAGYVTAWGEDMSHINTFQTRLNGFKEQPVDHYMRTYYLAADQMYSKSSTGCAGSELSHIRFLNYFRDMYHMYNNKRKFMFGFYNELSHEDNNGLKRIDGDLTNFLKDLRQNGYLNHTILILMADHGARFSDIRATQQGKLEERLPYLGVHFPPGFHAAYPDKVEQFRQNRHRLTTMFDIHETLYDLLDPSLTRPSRTNGRGLSLFRPIPMSRSCSDAGIEAHWCACHGWEDISDNEALKAETGNAIVTFINGLTEPARNLCQELTLKTVTSLTRYTPQEQLLKFKKSADRHGDIPDLSDKMTLNFEYLQATLVMTPGDGQFEVTVKHSLSSGQFSVRADDLSRTNKYGSAPACINKLFPSLRPYCYCTTGR